MKIYIAGKITGLKNFWEYFDKAEAELKKQGYKVMNPAKIGVGFEQDEYMHVCYSMIDVCDGVYFLDNWETSVGANLEREYAIEQGKRIIYQVIKFKEVKGWEL